MRQLWIRGIADLNLISASRCTYSVRRFRLQGERLPKSIKIELEYNDKTDNSLEEIRLPNEIRRDYLLNRYAIIASERVRRPTDFSVPSVKEAEETCPFCAGNESATPPADLVLLQKEGKIIQSRDENHIRLKDWRVRCFPNLYPALSPTILKMAKPDPFTVRRWSYGYHEVVVESPNHLDHPSQAPTEQIQLSLKAILSLLNRYYQDKKIKYVQVFRNHRKEAGASLSHPHSQIIALPFTPSNIRFELAAARRHFETKEQCIFCKIIEEELDSQRKIYENDHFFMFSPWASILPFEFWVIPKRHEPRLENITPEETTDLATTLKKGLTGLSQLLHDPPYNYGFHTSPSKSRSEFYHWHLEVYPKLSTPAGFELSTGVYINVTPPELAAESLRQLVVGE